MGGGTKGSVSPRKHITAGHNDSFEGEGASDLELLRMGRIPGGEGVRRGHIPG